MDDSPDSRVHALSQPLSSKTRSGPHKRKREDTTTSAPRKTTAASCSSSNSTAKTGRFAFSRPPSQALPKQTLPSGSNASSLTNSDRNDATSSHRERLQRTKESLLPIRKSLPIWSKQDEIREALSADTSQVLILTGATGSGKSTQVPQFLVDEPWMKPSSNKGKNKKNKGRYSAGCIAVTQPRRVAATGLAYRVASEMGLRVGRSARGWGKGETEWSVGCAVRFDNNVSTAANTHTIVKFLTEGVLLRELIADPGLNRYSAVVVDEVHERSIDVDFILAFLRLILAGKSPRPANRPLKVVVMSATADVDLLRDFFVEDSCSGPAPLENHTAEEGPTTTTTSESPAKESAQIPVSVCHVEGRLFPIRFVYLSQPSPNLYDSCLEAIKKIHTYEGLPGDILVFLPGKDPIEVLERLVNDYGAKMGGRSHKIMALPLFAAMPTEAQKRIFEPAPKGTRRVILATNIAETSITVPGVRHVIDTGKAKIKRFHHSLGLSSLVARAISQSSAIQRAGRAGREGPGTCHRLYTEHEFNNLLPEPVPEILRSDLTSCLLTLKARGVDDIYGFPFITCPSPDAIKKALIYLTQLEALHARDGSLTSYGKTMSLLPLPPMLAKVLVHAGTVYGPAVLTDAIDLVSVLSSEDIFIDPPSHEDRERALESRNRLFCRDGDHQTYVSVVQAYLEEETDRKSWARRHWVSHRAMTRVLEVRKQLIQQCASLGLGQESEAEPELSLQRDSDLPSSSATSSPPPLVQCLLAAFGTHTARLMPDRTYSTFISNQTMHIHPSSVLFGRKIQPEAILFTEHIYTTKSYARGVTMLQSDWLEIVRLRWERIYASGQTNGGEQ